MKRYKTSLSHYKLLTCKLGQLVPVSWFEVLPGDTIQQATSALVRCAPVVTPVMHPIMVRFHHWFVPNRLVWTNWPQFITGGPNGTDSTVHPVISFASPPANSTLGDHLGLPSGGPTAGAATYNALPFRAYALIWNEYYRDQDLQTALVVNLGDGVDATTNIALQNVCWEKDYATSARPFENKGAAVNLPFQETGTTNQTVTLQRSALGANTAVNVAQAGTAGDAISLDANMVRHAFAQLRFQEARAMFGSRYVEYLRYLGVRSSDARLQRPEYLGGGRNVIQFSEVLQTGVTTAGTGGGAGGVGQFGGHGISAQRTNRYRRFFEEHGIVMTLMSIRPKTIYTQRLDRRWIRGQAVGGMTGTREDYWQKELEHIGQQQLCLCELDYTAGFGASGAWQDKYDEYRHMQSAVGGLFRTTLDTWHLSREFAAPPALNSTFVSCVPSTRIFADTANDDVYVMANQSIQARRLVCRGGQVGRIF